MTDNENLDPTVAEAPPATEEPAVAEESGFQKSVRLGGEQQEQRHQRGAELRAASAARQADTAHTGEMVNKITKAGKSAPWFPAATPDNPGLIPDLLTAEQVLPQLSSGGQAWYEKSDLQLLRELDRVKGSIQIRRPENIPGGDVDDTTLPPITGLPQGRITQQDADFLLEAARVKREEVDSGRPGYGETLLQIGAGVGPIPYGQAMGQMPRTIKDIAEALGANPMDVARAAAIGGVPATTAVMSQDIWAAYDTAVDIPMSVVSGVAQAVIETFNFAADVTGAAGGLESATRLDSDILRKNLPKAGPVGEMAEPTVRFLAGFLLLGKMIPGIKGAKMTQRLARAGQETGKASIVATVTFDPNEGNVATFLNDFGVNDKWGVVEWLNTANPSDLDYQTSRDRMVNRLKNGLADAILGLPLDGIFETVGRVRYRNWQGTGVLVTKRSINGWADATAARVEQMNVYKASREEGMSHEDATLAAFRAVDPTKINNLARELQTSLIADAFGLEPNQSAALVNVMERMGSGLADIEVDVSGMAIKRASDGKVLWQKTAGNQNRPLSDINTRVGDTGGLRGNPPAGDRTRDLQGNKFSTRDLTRSESGEMGLQVTDAEIRPVWDASLEGSGGRASVELRIRGEAGKSKSVYDGATPLSADLINEALNLPDSYRYWYELGAEKIREIFPDLTPEEMDTFTNILVAMSARTEVGVDLFKATSIMGEVIAGRPSQTSVLSPTSAITAVRGDTLDIGDANRYKVGSFGGWFMYLFGRSDDIPLSVNDTWIADAFGIEHSALTSPEVYEAISRHMVGLRDLFNSKLAPGAEPWTTNQVQASIWGAIRNRDTKGTTSRFTGYVDSGDAMLDKLEAAGIQISTDQNGRRFIPRSSLIEPGVGDALGVGQGRRADARRMYLATQSTQVPGLSDVVGVQARLMEIANDTSLTASVRAGAIKHYQSIERQWIQVQSSFVGRRDIPLPSGTRETTTASEMAAIVRGEKPPAMAMAAADPAQRAVTGGRSGSFTSEGEYVGAVGTWEGNVETNIVIPLVDFGGPEARLIDQSGRAVHQYDRWHKADMGRTGDEDALASAAIDRLKPKMVQSKGQDAAVREMLDLGDDVEITIDHIRQVSQRPITVNEEELLDYLALTAHHTNQDGLYATRYAPVPLAVEEKFFEDIGRGGATTVSTSHRPAIFIPGYYMQLDQASKISSDLGLNFSAEQSPTGTMLYFFADEEVEAFFKGNPGAALEKATGVPASTYQLSLMDMQSIGVEGDAIAKRVDAFQGKILTRNSQPEWARSHSLSSRTTHVWENVLTQADRRNFHLTGGDEKVIIQRVERLRKAVLDKINKATEAAKESGDGDWRKHIKLTERERALLDPSGIGGKGLLGAVDPGRASRGVQERAVGPIGGVSKELRGRSELARLTAVTDEFAEQRAHVYRGVRTKGDAGRKFLSKNAPDTKLGDRPDQNFLQIKLTEEEVLWLDDQALGSRSPSWDRNGDTATFESRDLPALQTLISGKGSTAPASLRAQVGKGPGQGPGFAPGSGKSDRVTWLFQETGGQARGFTLMQEGERVIIGGLNEPDIATGLEEIFHGTRLTLFGAGDAFGIQAPEEMFESLHRAFGVDPRTGAVSVEQDEDMAASFLEYMLEGKAPSPELQPGFDLIAAEMRSSAWFRDRVESPTLTDTQRQFFDALMNRTDLPIKYGDGKFMPPINTVMIVGKIERLRDEGKNWADEIKPEDILNLSGKGSGYRFGDSPDDVLMVFAAYERVSEELVRRGVIGEGLTQDELGEAALRTYTLMMGRGEAGFAQSLQDYWRSNITPGKLSREMGQFALATTMYLRNRLNNLTEVSERAAKSGEPQDLAELVNALAQYQQVHVIFSDMRTAWGRMGHAFQEKAIASVDPARISQAEQTASIMGAIENSGDKDEFQRIAQLLQLAARDGDVDELPKLVAEVAKQSKKPGSNNGLFDKALGYFRNNLLSRPSTFATLSMSGAIFNRAWEAIEAVTGAMAVGDVQSLKRIWWKMVQGWSEVGTATRYGVRALKDNDGVLMPGSSWNDLPTGTSGAGHSVVRGLANVQGTPGRVMTGLDQVFQQSAARTSLMDEAYQQAMENLMKENGIVGQTVVRRVGSGDNQRYLVVEKRTGATIRTSKNKVLAQKESSAYNEKLKALKKEGKDPYVVFHDEAVRRAKIENDKAIQDGRLMDTQARSEQLLGSEEIQALPPDQRELAVAQRLMDEPVNERLINKAKDEATRYTLQGQPTSSPGRIGLWVLEQVPALKFLIPFAKTAIIFTERGIDYMPTIYADLLLAHTKNLVKNGRWRDLPPDASVLRIHAQTMKELASPDPLVVAKARGRLVAVGGVGASMFTLYQADRITGHGPSEPSVRSQWLETHQPYSIKVGDTWVSYKSWIGPVSLVMGMWANTLEGTDSGWNDDRDLYTAATFGTLQALGDQSFVTGLSSFLSAYEDPEKDSEKFVRDLAWGWVPWGQAQTGVQQVIDPTLRETSDMIEAWTKRTPFYGNEHMPARYNSLSEAGDIAATQEIALHNFLAPWRLKTDTSDPVIEEFVELGWAPGSVSHDRYGVDLTEIDSMTGEGTAYDDFNRFIQQPLDGRLTLREQLAKVINSKSYQRLSSITAGEEFSPKVKALRKVMNIYRRSGGLRLLRDHPDLKGIYQQVLEQEAAAASGDVTATDELEKILEQYR